MPDAAPAHVLSIAARGALAGAAGTVAMTVGEWVEQRYTHRPDSYVPAHTLRPAAAPARPRRRPPRAQLGDAPRDGGVRRRPARRHGRANLRGPAASFLHTWVRLSVDQTLENATGAGAPPPSWPRRELVIDVAHKASYAFATGLFADRLIRRAHELAPPAAAAAAAARLRLTRRSAAREPAVVELVEGGLDPRLEVRPVIPSISARASSTGIAALYGRAWVSASKTSATATSRPWSGISSRASPAG
jgi:hypothetical protein